MAITALIAGALVAPSSFAATSATPYLHHPIKPPAGECTQSGGRFGERSASAGVGADGDSGADLNADTVNDVWVAQPFCNIGANVDQGRVYLLSGKDFRTDTTSVIRTIDSPEPQAGAKFGFFISVIGDVDNDSVADIAIGTDSQDVGTNVDQGKAWVFSGASGMKLYDLNNPVPQADGRFGSRIGRAGDVNGDTVPDVIVGASNNDVGNRPNQGQAFIFDGKTGTPIRTLDMPATDQVTNGNFGLAVQGPGDVVGDSKPDQLVDASNFAGGLPSQGRMYVFDGATGSLARTINDPSPQPSANFGFQDVAPLSPGNVGGTAKPEIYGNGFLQDRLLIDEGAAWVFDGAADARQPVRYSLTDPAPTLGGQFGWSMSKTDYNHQTDATNDLYVGQSPHHTAGATNQDGGTYVFNGTNGSVLRALELPTQCSQPGASGNNGPNLGWTVSTPGDLNGDGEPDYVAGAPFFDRGTNQDEGVLLVFMSGETDDPNNPKPC